MTAEAHASFACFGSTCSVHVGGYGASHAVAYARQRLLGWHARFTRFSSDSELSRLNSDPRAEAPGVSAPPPADILETRKVLALVDRLKPQQRTVLRLRMAGLSYQEICRNTGHTYTWVNRHITEGRQALRRLIEESDP